MPLPKLTLLFRIEPGCLGPDGPQHIAPFCTLAMQLFPRLEPDRVQWQIVPRHDKRLDELEFHLASRRLSEEQASQYLAQTGVSLPQLRERIDETLARLVERYLASLD
ncbi:hypothetical protein [Aeromonas simiae]|uniref:hypothetical protein n=1 Tax=Aeromonas simiae TaxID=218936 RepID=UPI0005AA8EEC|nr:hypothetical protein [Aeromonas simiae]MDO2947505.1 hypothetical protein [Aeromonas simiae]MDO2951596.1 hypothetical protein [Aeromonas simiae]MDO2955065.1 hypothetical protein [Aeromonas simiae]